MYPSQRNHGYGTWWGAISAQNLGGGQKIINFWRVESEIGLKTSKNFHTTRVFQYWMFGREPYPTSLYSIGDSPPPPSSYRTSAGAHRFGARRRKACLGMPTDYGRCFPMWRCSDKTPYVCRRADCTITANNYGNSCLSISTNQVLVWILR